MIKEKGSGTIIAILVLIFLAFFACINIPLSRNAFEKILNGELSFREFTTEIHNAYVSDKLIPKNMFLNLNGLFARMSGRRVYNDAILLKNGMLSRQENHVDLDELSNGIMTLADFVEEQGGDFYYVQMPCKMDREKSLLPNGVEYNCNEEIDYVLQELGANKVDIIDLRTTISSTPDEIEQYFFSTDHHWNYTGAFVGFQNIAHYLTQTYPDSGIDLSLTEWEQWEKHTLENFFLGSIGKRVGTLYAGVDDLEFYTPKFDTTISCAVPKYRNLFKGDFCKSNMRKEFLQTKDYFGLNNYCAYIGGDYPLVQHRNNNASSDLKILLIKDSFTLPLQAYLSTLFQEIDVIDPRYYVDCTVADYINRTKPDIVMLMLNRSQFGNSNYTDFGVKSFIESEDYIQEYSQEKIELKPMDVGWNYTSIELEYGKKYLLSCEDIVISKGETDGVVTALYNATTKNLLSINIFDVEYCREKEMFRWVFETPDAGTDNIQLLLYAGVRGQNRNVGTIYQGVTLSSTNKS